MAARVFTVFLRLGLTSFGGPTAHLAFFHDEFVRRRRWLDEAAYADLVALCQFLPGPASSQAGLAIGYLRAGYRGAAMAWLGFTAPSAILMALFAWGLALGWGGEAAWLDALKLVAVAVVAQAVRTMGQSLWTDRRRAAIGVAAAIILLLAPLPAMQLAVIAAGAVAGRWLLARKNHRLPTAAANPLAVTGRTPSSRFDVVSTTPSASLGPCGPLPRHLGALAKKVGDLFGLKAAPVTDASFPAAGASPSVPGASPSAAGAPRLGARSPGRRAGALLVGAFAVSVVALPFAAAVTERPGLAVFDAFYRAGALVFGGGHVVLPLLEAEVVAPGWVGRDEFLAGYGAAQALPGPLFTIAAFLGAHLPFFESRLTGALVALVAIFAPSFLLVPGLLPFWSGLRSRRGARSALAGVNAAVVGLLLAALYDPVFTSSVRGAADFAWVLGAFGLLFVLRWPPWLVVASAAVAAEAVHRAPGLLAGV